MSKGQVPQPKQRITIGEALNPPTDWHLFAKSRGIVLTGFFLLASDGRNGSRRIHFYRSLISQCVDQMLRGLTLAFAQLAVPVENNRFARGWIREVPRDAKTDFEEMLPLQFARRGFCSWPKAAIVSLGSQCIFDFYPRSAPSHSQQRSRDWVWSEEWMTRTRSGDLRGTETKRRAEPLDLHTCTR